jgi:hypothetical protein
MGNNKTKDLKWGDDKKEFLDNHMKNSKNESIINFKQYKFPEIDPIEIIV